MRKRLKESTKLRVVELHARGWRRASIARWLKVSATTVTRVLDEAPKKRTVAATVAPSERYVICFGSGAFAEYPSKEAALDDMRPDALLYRQVKTRLTVEVDE